MRLAIVAPAFNEAEQIKSWIRDVDQFCEANLREFDKITLVIVDDGSKDQTYEACQLAPVQRLEVKPIKLCRNFGHQSALIAGLLEVTQLTPPVDAVITMDSDGEHPIEVVPRLILEWKSGDILVHTIRRVTEELPWRKRLTSRLFYALIRSLTGLPIEAGMADFKLWDGQLLRDVSGHLRKAGALRLFAVFLAPNSKRILFDQRVVPGRISRFNTRKMMSLAAQSVVFYSSWPMRAILGIGLISMAFSLLLAVYSVVSYFQHETVPGWASTMVAISFFAGANSLSLYIVAEYLLRMSFRSNLPLFVKAPNR